MANNRMFLRCTKCTERGPGSLFKFYPAGGWGWYSAGPETSQEDAFDYLTKWNMWFSYHNHTPSNGMHFTLEYENEAP